MNDITTLLSQLLQDPAKKQELITLAESSGVFNKPFVPNAGAQTAAYYSEADVLLYGGQAGGGKSGLGLGLAVNEHRRSLVIRRNGVDVIGLVDNLKGILKTVDGFTMGAGGNRPTYKSPDGRVVHFEGYGDVNDINGKQGTPHDLIYIDEAAQLPLHAIQLLMGWCRTTVPNQRCRVVLASNPPLDTTGDWMIDFFAPWLDATHPNPAKHGELRWFITDDKGRDVEVEGKDSFIEINGEQYYPLSRTFIPATVNDNPYIDASYKNTLNSLPEPYRSALRDGNFLNARQDNPWQVIPTEWVRLAQKRWHEYGRPNNVPQCAIGVDVAQGGCFDDKTEILTNEGWKLFDVLHGNEKVLTLNGDVSEWGDITELHKYWHDGYMNLYEGYKGIDFCITDNHQLLYIHQKHKEWTIRRFDDLPKFIKLVNTCRWGGVSEDFIEFNSIKSMPNGGFSKRNWKFTIVDWAKLVGWFVSEGCAFNSARVRDEYIVNISQAKQDGFNAIGDLLKKMGIKAYNPKSRKGWEFCINGIGKHLLEHCGQHAKNKRIPNYIKNGSQEVIEAFLETYQMGDGSVNGVGVVSYSTTSKQLADDLHEVLGKIGCAGKMIVVQKAGSVFYIGERKVVRKNDVYNVYRSQPRNAQFTKDKVLRVPYKGYVYCVSTPYKSIFVRRNGKTMWSGNSDKSVLAIRYDGWYDDLIVVDGAETPTGASIAALVLQHRRGAPEIVIDMGGGYGGAAYEHLKENGIKVKGHKGAEKSLARTSDGLLKFVNKRSEIIWKFREALDPSQDGGSPIMLPDNPKLVSDLCSPLYTVTSNGVKVEPKEELVKRLGRSTDAGDAVCMAWGVGLKQENINGGWAAHKENRQNAVPRVNMGRNAMRKK
jgi:hypothetical protein